MKNTYAFIVLLLASCLIFSCGEKPKKKPAKSSPKKEVKRTTPDPKETKTEAAAEEPAAEEQVVPIPPQQLAKAKTIIEGVSDADVDAIDAKKKYKMLCATCHGFTGDLNVNGAKDLTKSKISLQEAVAQVYHGRGLMTPFKGIMEDAEIVAVAKYIKTLRK